MGIKLNVIEHNLHQVEVDATQMLFHIPTSSLFTQDELTTGILVALRAGADSPEQVHAALRGRFPSAEVDEALEDLVALQVVSDGSPLIGDVITGKVTKTALNTVVLNVNTGCNLSCTYCYKEDLDKPTDGKRMSAETAIASVEMLLEQSPEEQRYTVVFFGGEPLSNRPLIEYMVDYCERRFGELGKDVDFVMTTNATMLTEDIVDYLNRHRFGLSISMDGPKAIHDKNRITVSGQGTYEVVRRKAEMLLSRYNSRPVGARVTLTRGTTEVEEIWDHLINDLGFAEVGFAPVTSGDISSFNLTEAELVTLFANFKALGRRYLDAALKGENIGFSNLHQLLTDIHEGHKKSLPCGAGLKMLAVDYKGELNLCHRFTGSSLPTFGNVHAEVDNASLTEFLSERLDRNNTGCQTCRIRNLCSGGCYHESYSRYGDPQHPNYHYCELLRDWVDFGIEVYARIMRSNPDFITRHIVSRKVH